MRFGVVIGNPPYSVKVDERKGGYLKNIYQHFIRLGMTLSEDIVMITKNSWITSVALEKDREAMIKYGLLEIINYTGDGDIYLKI